MALGLDDLVALDGAELADRAVDRAHQIGIGHRARGRMQGAREEGVEAFVMGDVGVCRLAQVDLVAADEPSDQARRQPPGACRRDQPGKLGQRQLGQQILDEDGNAFGQGEAAGQKGVRL